MGYQILSRFLEDRKAKSIVFTPQKDGRIKSETASLVGTGKIIDIHYACEFLEAEDAILNGIFEVTGYSPEDINKDVGIEFRGEDIGLEIKTYCPGEFLEIGIVDRVEIDPVPEWVKDIPPTPDCSGTVKVHSPEEMKEIFANMR